jgi:tricorn protease
MKKAITLMGFLLIVSSFVVANVKFAIKPALSPDASTIYFSFNGDIYKVPVNGGDALTVISTKGFDSNPKISPDGKMIAFSSDLDGNNNVYVASLSGGDIVQLTWNDASDVPVSWTPDSKHLFIESGRYNQVSTYLLPVTGGTPKRLFTDYFNTVTNLVVNPVSGKYIFNESMDGYSFATRRGYRGEHNADLLEWDPVKREYSELTTFDGKDLWPMTDKKGNIYYASEEVNGYANLVKYAKPKNEFLTRFESAIQYPSIAFDGDAIVFIKDYSINIYDIKSKKVTTPEINLNDTRIVGEIAVQVEKPEYAALSPDGKKLAFSYRGALFVSDNKGNFITKMPTDPQERVTELLWNNDSTVYYIRTNKGFSNLYKMVAGATAEIAVYTPQANVKSITLSNKRDKMVFTESSGRLMLMTFRESKPSEISRQEFWSFQSYPFNFSSDDKNLIFSAMNLFDRDIFIYNFETKSLLNLTNSTTPEDDAQVTNDGKYMYFTSNRETPSFPRGARETLFRVALNKTDTPFNSDEFSKLFKTSSQKKDSVLKINTTDFQRRYEPVVRGGGQYSPYLFNSGSKSYLLFNSNHEGQTGLYVQELKDWDQKPPKKVNGIQSAGTYISNGKTILVLCGDGLFTVDPAGASATKIEIKYTFPKKITDEFRQMLFEVWGLLEQNFYDVNFHGTDWYKVREKYASYLPYVKTRAELRMLVTDMLGELNSSHLGFSSNGREEDSPFRLYTSGAGILFEEDNPFVVKGIIRNSKADVDGLDIKPGDELVEVEGKRVLNSVDRDFYFTGPQKLSELKMVFKRDGKEFRVNVHTNTTGEIRDLMYLAWEDNCREMTERLSNGKFAYIHLRDMGDNSLNSFLIDMNTYAIHKDGLILDLRYNNGGNVHKEVIDYLLQKQHFRWSYRDKEKFSHPVVTPSEKPLIVLINERSLSDAEVTSNGIQQLGIAKIVGTESYRWIIFTSGAMLVDGSFCRLPAWGCYSLNGKDLEKTGVKPDIYVKNTFLDRVESKDPQLERAVKELLSL